MVDRVWRNDNYEWRVEDIATFKGTNKCSNYGKKEEDLVYYYGSNYLCIDCYEIMRIGKSQEMKLTDHLTVKLKDRSTVIYINGREFRQCKYLLLTLENKHDWDVQKEFTSIDEAAFHLGRDHERNGHIIPPETEFWGHCSNLQAWVENDYDLRIIHTNLGFPLLKKLAEYDKNALISLKEEIADRIEATGYKAYELHRDVIDKFFNEEETEVLQIKIKENIISLIEQNEYNYNYYLRFKRYIKEFFTEEEEKEILENIKYHLIQQIKEQYQDLDIYSLLNRNCTLCKEVFSKTGHQCTFCSNYNNFIARDGIIIPKEKYENLVLSNLSFHTLLHLFHDLKPNNKTPYVVEELPKFAGGAGMDNDMTARGDYTYTINYAMSQFHKIYGELTLPLRILTSLGIRSIARVGCHFYELAGISEVDIIMKLEEIEMWEVSNDIEPDVMYIYDQLGNGIKTGRLTIL